VLGRTNASDNWYKFILPAGESATIGLQALTAGSLSNIELRDASNNLLAVGAGGASNLTQVVPNFIAPSGGTYYVHVNGDLDVDYNLVVMRNAGFDLGGNATRPTAQLVSTGQSRVLGAIQTATDDFYSFTGASGQVVTLSTTTPGDGPFEFVNTLNPRLVLLNSAGTVLASDDNSAPDGRNATLTFTLPAAGTYYVQVSSTTASATSGEYVLNIAGASLTAPPFAVSSTSIPNGAVLLDPPTQIVVDFNDSVLLTSLQASDLTLNGVPATGFSHRHFQSARNGERHAHDRHRRRRAARPPADRHRPVQFQLRPQFHPAKGCCQLDPGKRRPQSRRADLHRLVQQADEPGQPRRGRFHAPRQHPGGRLRRLHLRL
jgi:hypothetical protein